MNKQLSKHQKKQHYIKIYLVDDKGTNLTNFDGVILSQNSKFILMMVFADLYYDGYVVFRKSDVSEIRRSKNEQFIHKILLKEGVLTAAIDSYTGIRLNTMEKMFKELKKRQVPVIVEQLYRSKDLFQIGPIHSTTKKMVRIDHFNSHGIYDLKPAVSKYKDITYFRVDDNYSILYHKYSKHLD
ncbi:MAG: hypothetical protein ACI8ZM_001188 [Crocinitomix sp.]|jgi:hypothetical protein